MVLARRLETGQYEIQQKMQSEETRMTPCSPYAIAKLAAHHLVRTYREAYGIFACSGILFNHESPRRGQEFVTKKIAMYVGKVGRDPSYKDRYRLTLGNLDAYRDWGHASDYVRGMWLMLQHSKPDDFVLATGETHSVREFAKEAFACIGITDYMSCIALEGSLLRPAEVPHLCGLATKAKQVLGWEPNIKFHALVKDMVNHELQA
jgi:GDPmannose 4,6-dehydratase